MAVCEPMVAVCELVVAVCEPMVAATSTQGRSSSPTAINLDTPDRPHRQTGQEGSLPSG